MSLWLLGKWRDSLPHKEKRWLWIKLRAFLLNEHQMKIALISLLSWNNFVGPGNRNKCPDIPLAPILPSFIFHASCWWLTTNNFIWNGTKYCTCSSLASKSSTIIHGFLDSLKQKAKKISKLVLHCSFQVIPEFLAFSTKYSPLSKKLQFSSCFSAVEDGTKGPNFHFHLQWQVRAPM